MIKIIEKEKLPQFLEKLSQKYNIAAPVIVREDRDERIEYRYVDDFSRIVFDKQPDKSPKNILLPQNEKLGHDITVDNGNNPELKSPEKETIIFGIRTCDIEAIDVLDSVFLEEECADPYYQQRRKQTVLFGFSCKERHSSCFCDTLGLNPVRNEKVPVTIYEEEDKFWFEITDNKYEEIFTDLSNGKEEKLNNIIKDRQDTFKESRFDFNISLPLAEHKVFSAPFWDDIAAKCLNCGVCTFYCPTCYCFGFFWDGENKETEKWRKWDSCMFTLFTKHASGHNPRDKKEQRFRQRLMHKFSYHPQNYDQAGCVGCGRCLDKCPVNLDIREALNTIEDYLKKEGEAVTNER